MIISILAIILFIGMIISTILSKDGGIPQKKMWLLVGILLNVAVFVNDSTKISYIIHSNIESVIALIVILLLVRIFSAFVLDADDLNDNELRSLMWISGPIASLITTVGWGTLFTNYSQRLKGFDKAIAIAMGCNLMGLVLVGDPPFIYVCQWMGISAGVSWQFNTFFGLLIIFWIIWLLVWIKNINPKNIYNAIKKSHFRFDKNSLFTTKIGKNEKEVLAVFPYQAIYVAPMALGLSEMLSGVSIIPVTWATTSVADNYVAVAMSFQMVPMLSLLTGIAGGMSSKFGNMANVVFDEEDTLGESMRWGYLLAGCAIIIGVLYLWLFKGLIL